MTVLSGAVNNGPRALGALVVGVGRADFAVGVALVVEAALRFGLALLVLLTIAAQARERHRFEAFFGDLQPARLADTVTAVVETLECVVDLLELNALAVGQDEI